MLNINKRVIILSSLLIGYSALNAIVYSLEGAQPLYQKSFGSSVVSKILMADLGLSPNDDIDALSLGDDPNKFGKSRVDIFAVSKNAIGTTGAVKSRKLAGKNIGNDIYAEDDGNNTLLIDTLDNNQESQIDGFDFGYLKEGDWIYFSVKPTSLTSKKMSVNGILYDVGDILMVRYKMPSTLKVYAHASELGNPGNINALSIYDAKRDGGDFNATTDYIIYSQGASNILDANVSISGVYHYGFGAAGGFVIPHADGAEFGLRVGGMGKGDDVYALEHNLICHNPCLDIVKGWKMYGTDDGIHDVPGRFSDSTKISIVYAYDENLSRWKAYSPNPSLQLLINADPNIDNLIDIKEQEGFWIKGLQNHINCEK